MSIGLLIADRHDLIRDGLRAMFAHGDIVIVAEARKPWEVQPLVRDHAIDVVLLSVSWGRFRGEDGIQLLREIRVEHAELPILMYSVYDWISLIEKCRQLGANGYLVKGVDDQLLRRAVQAVYDGDGVWADQRRDWRIRRVSPLEPKGEG